MRSAALLLPLSLGQDLFLQKTAQTTDPDVVIIGAGWAGMSAAHHLAQAGVSFVVLEADNRTGGRTKALEFGHESVGKFIFEQGSNWVCGAGDESAKGNSPSVLENPVLTLAKEQGLKTAYIQGATDGNMSNYYKVYDEFGNDADPSGELRDAANAALACLNRTAAAASNTKSVRDGLTACGWNPSTNAEWAMDWALASDESGVRAKYSALNGFLPDPTYDWWGGDDWFVIDQHPRGYARLIDGMVKDTIPTGDPRLVLNARVNKIDWGKSGVAVSTTDGRTFNGKHAIFTASIGVLRKHHEEMFSPGLPDKQVSDLVNGHYPMANLTHVLIQFPSVWWDNTLPAWVSANAGGKDARGLFTAWHNLHHDTMIPGSNTLLTFLGEPEASVYGLMTEEELLPIITNRLRAQNPNKTVPDGVAAWLKNWGNDPNTEGAYAYAEPGISWSGKWKKPLKKDKKKIVTFAGEATCDMMDGYTHGAMQSGKEAAAAYLYENGLGPNPANDDALSLCVWYDYYN